MKTLVARLEAHFEVSFGMLVAQIDACPEGLWYGKTAGFPFWQQILHALCGIDFWLRGEGEAFSEPFAGRKLFPELDGEPESRVEKKEMLEYAASVGAKARRFFSSLDDGTLAQASAASASLTKLDVVETQIRHLMYHAGHCDAGLRERGVRTAPWLEVEAR